MNDSAELIAAKKLLSIESILVPAASIPLAKYDGIREAAINQLLVKAYSTLKGVKMTVRGLVPSDLGLTNEVWQEITGATANAWENTTVAGGSTYTIAAGRLVCIWGLVFIHSDAPPVSAVRFTVGNAQIAKWPLDELLGAQDRVAISLSPIVISENIEIKIERYVKIANTGCEIVYVGAVAEREGKVLRP